MGVVDPVTNVSRTDQIDAFQRLQSARTAADPKNAARYGNGDDNIE
jgi:hypothetical protein